MIRTYEDFRALLEVTAYAFVEAARDAVVANGSFAVALSGGSTPKKLYESLAGLPYRDLIEWERVHVYWSDERYVPPTDEQSNERMAREALLSHVPIPREQIHGMYRPGGAQLAAAKYAEEIPAWFDLVMLGLGPDGHTASLFPRDPSITEEQARVVASRGAIGITERITLTPPAILASQSIWFIVTGADKAEAVWRTLEGPDDPLETPAQAIARGHASVEWFMDRLAASKLP